MTQDEIRLRVVRADGALGLKIDSEEDPYSDTLDEFGGMFTKEKLGEKSPSEGPKETASPTQTSTPPETEQQFKERVARALITRTSPYRNVEVRSLHESERGLSVSGLIHPAKHLSKPPRAFQSIISTLTWERELAKVRAAEGKDPGVIL